MKAQRSNTATRLRRHSAGLFGISESDMLRSEVRKEKFRARIGWVENGLEAGIWVVFDRGCGNPPQRLCWIIRLQDCLPESHSYVGELRG